MPRLTLALLVSACVLVLAACGGSSGLTKAQYDAKKIGATGCYLA